MLKQLAISGLACVMWLSALNEDAEASFHKWDISEVYSNADGSVQFIELFVSATSNERFLLNMKITSAANSNTFTFPSHSPPTSTNHLLIATPGFALLPGAVVPDFTLPVTNFFSAASDTINFANVDIVAISGAPTDGINSLNFPGGVAVNSPTNFAGAVGELVLPLLGDLDDSGGVDTGDVATFFQALVDPDQFEIDHPTVDAAVVGNINGDGLFDLGDIALFSGLFGGPASASAQAIPEPATPSLAVILLLGITIRQRRRG